MGINPVRKARQEAQAGKDVGFGERLTDIASWPAAHKSLLVSVAVLGLCLYATGLLYVARFNPERFPFIDPWVLGYQIDFSFLTIGCWVLLGVVSFAVPARRSNSAFFEHAPIQLFAISNVLFAYLYGFFTDPYGFVTLIGGMLVGIPLFGTVPTRLGLVSWLLIFTTLSLLEQVGVIPYAPILRNWPVLDGSLSIFWALGMGSVNVIGGLLCAFFGFFLLSRMSKHDQLLKENQGKLLSTVNTLSETTSDLEESRRELELRVDERTLELKVANRNLEFEIEARERAAIELTSIRAAMEAAIEGVARVGADGHIESVNAAFIEMHGARADEMIGSSANAWIAASDRPEMVRAVLNIADGGKAENSVAGLRSDASDFPQFIAAVKVPGGEPGQHYRFARDVTRQSELSAQLNQATKMEAIGHLAGGIAHDFNNLLMAILTASEHLQDFFRNSGPDDEELEMADMITMAATRAAALTSQLLDFAHARPSATTTFDVNESFRNMFELLRPALDESIQVCPDFYEYELFTEGDAARFDSGLLNVALNARDAMPGGGTLTVRSAAVEIDPSHSRFANFSPTTTSQARIDLIDDGCGMEPSTMERVFDPFFTTKPAGKGTGLGLSVFSVYLREIGGAMTMESALGEGTTCSIYVPLCPERPTSVEDSPPTIDGRGSETILLVEDEDMVAVATSRLLVQRGYGVVRCANGLEALSIFRERGEDFDVVLLDYRMPVMGGAEALEGLKKMSPRIPVVLMSGNLSPAELRSLEDHGLDGVIGKPCSGDALAAKIRETVDLAACRR
ncbi:MAG: response regulator [Myxococcota bacterium]|nr:response regulator [Myxococcota bacterium]